MMRYYFIKVQWDPKPTVIQRNRVTSYHDVFFSVIKTIVCLYISTRPELIQWGECFVALEPVSIWLYIVSMNLYISFAHSDRPSFACSESDHLTPNPMGD